MKTYGTDFISTLAFVTAVSAEVALEEDDSSMDATITEWAHAICIYYKSKDLEPTPSYSLRKLYIFILANGDCSDLDSYSFNFNEFEIKDIRFYKTKESFIVRNPVIDSSTINHIVSLAVKIVSYTNNENDILKCIPFIVSTGNFERGKVFVDITLDFLKVNCENSYNKLGQLVLCIMNDKMFENKCIEITSQLIDLSNKLTGTFVFEYIILIIEKLQYSSNFAEHLICAMYIELKKRVSLDLSSKDIFNKYESLLKNIIMSRSSGLKLPE